MPTLRTTILTAASGLLMTLLVLPHAVQAAREQRSTGEFTAIVANGPFEVHVRQGDRTSVEVEADDAVLPLIETVVEPGDSGSVLQLRLRRGTQIKTNGRLRVHISTAQLRSVALRGSGDLRLSAFQTPSLNLSVAGSGDALLKSLTTELLAVSIAGSGNVTADGRSTKLNVSIAGSGDARLRELQSADVDVNIAGSGDVQVHAQQSLSVNIAGSGDVRYLGAPSLKSRIMGSGEVKALR